MAVTRAADDAGELEEQLRVKGAVPVPIPLTRILPAVDDAPLRRALAALDDFDWVVFTSARAVRAIAGLTSLSSMRPRVAAVGPATASAVRELIGRDPDIVPSLTTGAAVVPAMLQHHALKGARVLWPRAEQPRAELPRDLVQAGARLEDPVAYRIIPDLEAGSRLARMDAAAEVDVITFTAPSAVDCFASAQSGPIRSVIAVIGPTTAAAARTHGLPVHVAARKPIISALVAALAEFHERGSQQKQ